MADIVTGTVTGQLDTTAIMQDHADIRREGAVERGDIRQEIAKSFADTRFASASQSSDVRKELSEHDGRVNHNVQASAWNVSDRVGTEADRVVGQNTAYFIAQQQEASTSARDIAALKSLTDLSYQALQMQIQNGIDRAAAATALEGTKNASATALESAKVAAAVALGQAIIERTIIADGASTRALINDMKYHDNSRTLIERGNELVECRQEANHLRTSVVNAQYANLNNQLNAFQSQLQETRQGMVNFGSMSGVGQTSTSNNVR